MKVLAVIPARMHSSRLPGKPLLAETGKPLIQHVWETVEKCKNIDNLIVATDSMDIVAAVNNKFSGSAVVTSCFHRNGSERVHEVFHNHDEYDTVLNIQCDYPNINYIEIVRLILEFSTSSFDMMTFVAPLSVIDRYDENKVKAIVSDGRILYFSRNYIPNSYLHIGIYIYKPKCISLYGYASACELEQKENLEQIRILRHGFSCGAIHYIGNRNEYISINTIDDYIEFVEKERMKSLFISKGLRSAL